MFREKASMLIRIIKLAALAAAGDAGAADGLVAAKSTRGAKETIDRFEALEAAK